ncbi:helix-turn-helix domain-containing protein [Kribbella sp. NPDC051718]|uniref:helix-turn-helix domain-containing protein n=1 Tax=Kribbella sp. NPDC051718 TaxID=3155168 RepID=UPI003433330B
MLFSVEQVAEQLGLHVRTVRSYVRDGKLNAVRIGKQYRISREDLEAFTGIPAVDDGGASERRVEVSSIVQVDAIDRAGADRISTHLGAAVSQGGLGRLRVESAYDEDRSSLKLIILGEPEVTADLLRVVALLAKA